MSSFIQEEWQSTLSWMWHCDDWHKFVAARGDERHCIPLPKCWGNVSPYPPAVDARDEDEQYWMLWQRKHRWMGHVLRHDGLLHEIIEERMTVSQQEEIEYCMCYMIWLNEQLKIGRMEIQWNDVRKLLCGRRQSKEREKERERERERERPAVELSRKIGVLRTGSKRSKTSRKGQSSGEKSFSGLHGLRSGRRDYVIHGKLPKNINKLLSCSDEEMRYFVHLMH